MASVSAQPRRRADGAIVWSPVLSLGRDPVTGKRVQRRLPPEPTEAAALAAGWAAIADGSAAGPAAATDRLTVGAWLDEWLGGVARRRSPRTHASYLGIVERELRPAFGVLPLADLDGRRVQRLLDDLSARGLAPGSVAQVRAILRIACRRAVVLGVLDRDPTLGTEVPPPTGTVATVWTPAQSAAFWAVARATPGDGACAALLLFGWVRIGELLALRWDDLQDGVLTVRRAVSFGVGNREFVAETTKGRRVRRVVCGPELLAALQRQRLDQARRRAACPVWCETGVLIDRGDGQRWRRLGVTRRLHALMARAGVPVIRLHDLRHSGGSQALAAGVPLAVVSERLGHASPAITLRVYTHVVGGDAAALATTIEGAIVGVRDETCDQRAGEGGRLPHGDAAEGEAGR